MMTLLVFAAGGAALNGQIVQSNFFDAVNLPIPDGDVSGVQDVRTISSDITQITSVRVRLNISGEYNGDLYGYVRHNDGVATHVTVLLNRPGRSTGNNYGYANSGMDVLLDDAAASDIHVYQTLTNVPADSPLLGTWQPDARFVDPAAVTTDFPRSAFFSTFQGLNAGGQWTLFLADVDQGATNFLNNWALEITGKATPLITWTNPAPITYGTGLGASELDAVADVPGTFTYDPPSDTRLTAGSNQTLTVTFQPDDTNSYVTATANVPITVLPAALTVTVFSQSRIYGAANPTFDGTIVGLQNSDDISPNFVTAADTSSPVGVYPIIPGLLDPAGRLTNYTVSSNEGALTVDPAPLLIRANELSRAYGDTNPPFSVTILGFVNGEDINALEGELAFITTAETRSPVGTYAVAPEGLTATNYSLTFSNGILNIFASSLTLNIDSAARFYGGTNPPLHGLISGLQNEDDISVDLSVAADTNSPVGIYPIIPSLVDLGGKLVNYTIHTNNGALAVDPAPLMVKAEDTSRTYGDTNPNFLATITGFVDGEDTHVLQGELVFHTTADTNSPVGTYQVEPGGLSAVNYSPTFSNGLLSINPALLVVKADDSSRAYGGTNPPFTATFIGFVNDESLTNSDITGEPLLETLAGANSPVGGYDITSRIGTLNSTNYFFSFSNGTLNVTAYALTLNVDSLTRPYGATNPPLTGTIIGLQNGEDISADFSVAAETNSPVGAYPIVPGLIDPGGRLVNYTVLTNNGSLTIEPAPLLIQAQDVSRAYGETNPAFTATFAGFVNGEGTNVLEGALAFSTTAETNSPVGTYAIVPDGLAATNYSLTFSNGDLNVTVFPLMLDVDSFARPYGHSNPPLTGTISGLQNGDDISADLSTAAESNSPAGVYPIFPVWIDAGNKLANYLVTTNGGELTIEKAVSLAVLGSSANPAFLATEVTFTVNLAPLASGIGVPSGTVQFKIDGLDYGTPVTLSGGAASLTTATLASGEHAVSAEYVGNGNFLGALAHLNPAQVVKTPIVAGADVIYRIPPQGARVPASLLLANDTDGNGEPMFLSAFDANSAAGGTLTESNGWIYYTPPTGFANEDSFHYTVTDTGNGLATGVVTISVLPDHGPGFSLAIHSRGNGLLQLVATGTPWGNFTIEYSDSLTNLDWRFLATGTADSSGHFAAGDVAPPGSRQRFYRAKYEGEDPPSWPFLLKLTTSANQLLPGTPVTFTVNFTNLPPTGTTPSGSVQFYVDGNAYENPLALANASASLTTDALAPGAHTIEAVYSGDANFRSATCFLPYPEVINTAPIASNNTFQLNPMDIGLKFRLSDLNCSDPDGNPLVVKMDARSAEGGTIAMADGWAFYTQPNGYVGTDSFTYIVEDSFGSSATSTVQILPSVGNGGSPSANLTIVDQGNGTFSLFFSGIPGRNYAIEYAENLSQPIWQTIANRTADAKGLFSYEDTLPEGALPRYYRCVSQAGAIIASPFRIAVWSNFVGQTNGKTMDMWSQRILPAGWPNSPPILAWNTNCLLYGLDGFTGISQCNEFEGALGQIPLTLLTRRHCYVRGHSMGPNGFSTVPAGQRVWFCAANNQVVQMTVAAMIIRYGSVGTNAFDYGIMVFTGDVPQNIRPVSVISPANLEIFYLDTPDLPYLYYATEQLGHCAANVPPFLYPIVKGGDSGSPNLIPSPDNKLIMFSGRATTGFSPQVQADMDTLSTYVGVNPNNYQLKWYDLSPWGP